MNYTLVGYTGFVGRNLAVSRRFDNVYRSTDIQNSFGEDNGLVVYSGMPSEKYLANADPDADFNRAEQAMDNIRKMRPEKLVLISTVDVYAKPVGVFEDSPAGGEGVTAYGKNRYALETWVREEYPEALIVRLPGLFGRGLKKNFIFDMLTLVPTMLTAERFEDLRSREPLVSAFYMPGESGFYKLEADASSRTALKRFFSHNDFNSLSFTDSRSVYQFYDLSKLWRDIERCMKANLRLVNLATEPVEAGALYHFLFGEEFENHLEGPPARYDMRTHFGRELGGNDNYVADRTEVVSSIAKFAGQALLEGGGWTT